MEKTRKIRRKRKTERGREGEDWSHLRKVNQYCSRTTHLAISRVIANENKRDGKDVETSRRDRRKKGGKKDESEGGRVKAREQRRRK